jgi:hypothetical protein
VCVNFFNHLPPPNTYLGPLPRGKTFGTAGPENSSGDSLGKARLLFFFLSFFFPDDPQVSVSLCPLSLLGIVHVRPRGVLRGGRPRHLTPGPHPTRSPWPLNAHPAVSPLLLLHRLRQGHSVRISLLRPAHLCLAPHSDHSGRVYSQAKALAFAASFPTEVQSGIVFSSAQPLLPDSLRPTALCWAPG